MLPLRFPWFWQSLGWALVLAVCVASLLPGPALPQIPVSDKFEHAVTYFLLMVWFAGLYPRARHLRIGLLLVGLGLALDIAQAPLETRQFDLLDVAANTGGILLALALSRLLLEGWCGRVERLFSA